MPNAYPAASRLIRNGDSLNISFEKLLRNPRSRYNFEIAENDVIYIGQKSNLVSISGGVNVDGLYQYSNGKTLNDFVKMAGGFTKNADRLQSFVLYPDGTNKKNGLFNSYIDVFSYNIFFYYISNLHFSEKFIISPN